ncbi:MAG: hypothetical protein R8M45_04535 [Ghiorsea sp.]
MKISTESMTLLKNFATINSSIVIEAGNVQKTLALSKNILASATLPDSFPQKFGIYDLSAFLNVLNAMPDANLTFEDKYVIIESNGAKVKYVFCDIDNIHPAVPDKSIDEIMPEGNLTFVLSADSLQRLQKMAGVLGVEDLTFTNDNGNIIAKVSDLSSSSSNGFELTVGEVDASAEFEFNYKIERLRLMSDDYNVNISSKLISHFVGVNNDFEALITLEKSSTSSF